MATTLVYNKETGRLSEEQEDELFTVISDEELF